MDASTFMLLVEDSGDSELADLHLGSNSGLSHLPGGDNDDDDAESCSWDSLDQCSRERDLDGGNRHEVERVGNSSGTTTTTIGNYYKQEKKARKEEDGVGGYQESWSSSSIGGEFMVKQKSCVSEESKANESPLNEVERNRLFWEACLAS